MACGVPKLQAVRLAHMGHCFSENIDADCLFVELVVVGGVFQEDGGLADWNLAQDDYFNGVGEESLCFIYHLIIIVIIMILIPKSTLDTTVLRWE